jgi:AmmeMemoRadiSam system protein B
MIQIREPAVAGKFYPDHPGELSKTVRDLLAASGPAPGPAPKALIVPHAGYVYSGPVAASAYECLIPHRDAYHRVVLLGPSHWVSFSGLALSTADAFHTPLGDVPLDRDVIERAGRHGLSLADEPHGPEHSLEVQLPFLQYVLSEFSLVPVVVGQAKPEAVAKTIDSLWGGPETLVVVSSDLSHYLPYVEARRRDEDTCHAIETLDDVRIGPRDACGSTVVRGLLIAARERSLRFSTLDLRNSGDTAGGRDGVVGYGSWLLVEESA